LRRIFIGFLLIFLNFNLQFGNIVIDCIPNFIGYIYLIQGLRELEKGEYSSYFTNAIVIAKGLFFYETITFFSSLFGFTTFINTNYLLIATIVGIIYILASLYCSYLIIQGFIEMRNNFQDPYETDKLYTIWKAIAIIQIVAFLLLMLMPTGSIICYVILFIINIMFLVSLNRLKNGFEEPKL